MISGVWDDALRLYLHVVSVAKSKESAKIKAAIEATTEYKGAETLAVTVIGSALKDRVALVILCLILVVRPTGLFGEAPIVKV